MGYIENIRKYVGHEPVFFCGCGILIFNDQDEILLQKRSDDLLWGNPGGALELGETIEEAIIRETKEETNLDIKKEDLKIFKIYSGEEGHHIYPNQDEVYIVNIMFLTRNYRGTLQPDKEGLELKFFKISEMPTELTELFQPIARDLKKLKKLNR